MNVWRSLLLSFLIVTGSAMALVGWWLTSPLPLAGASVELSIEPGNSPREVAAAWVRAGVQTEPWALYELFRWSGKARRIRAGSYELEPGITPLSLLAKMVQGDEAFERVRLIEGWTFRQFRAELARATHLKPSSAGMSDADLMAAIGHPGVAPEGRFFPDTYVFSRGVSDLTVLRRAADLQRQRLASVWASRADDLPIKTADQALVLASIIEKETGLAADRGKISGVFINRLRIGMPLQTDPSVIYGLGEAFDGNLRRRDLQADTPHNTYTRNGLPPTPIAMPGLASLRAAVQPETTSALYFVARGDGSSVFSDDLAAHNRAVNQFQRNQRGSAEAEGPAGPGAPASPTR
jgi:UPF0755 protein